MLKGIIEQPELFSETVNVFLCINKDEQIKIGTIERTNSEGYKATRTKDGKVLHTIERGKALDFILLSKETKQIKQINLF